MKNKILIISGDPNSINSEIIYKSWKKLPTSIKKNIYIITSYDLLKEQFKILKYPIKMIKVEDINKKIFTNKLQIINVNVKFQNPFKVSNKASSIFIKNKINMAHKMALKENIKGIINCPIDKKLLQKKNQGITEFLASKCGVKNNSEVMLIKSKHLSVSPITTHLDLKDVAKKINAKLIIKKITTIDKWFKSVYKKKPKIGLLGLNPHNAELRKNSEENKIIIPAINKCNKIGFKVSGPLIADTLFMNDYKKYDVLVGMYHDQVLAPFKTIFKFEAINITLGLKYLRLSPDHGVAKNIIKKKIANHTSLLRCVEFLNKVK